MRYHIVVYKVPDIHSAEQIPIVDEEWESSADEEAMTIAAESFVRAND